MPERNVSKNIPTDVLVEQVKRGDKEAFMKVTHLYQQRIFILAFSFFRNKEDALDIVQETFFRFYQKIHLFKKGSSLQNWLLQIAKNLCVDYYRKHYKKGALQEKYKDLEEMSHESSSFPEQQHDPDLKEIFSKCLEKLPERQRMVFVMKHYNQFEYKEIAQIMKIAMGSAKSLHFKAVKNLKVLISPYLGRQA